MCWEKALVRSNICTETHRLVIKACQMLLIITVNCKKKKKEQHVKLLLYTSHSMILGRIAAFSYYDCSKRKIFRRRRKKSYEQWITSSENTKNKYKNNRTPSCTGTSCEHGEIYWYNYTFYVKDRYSYNTRSNDDVALIDDTISQLTFSSG